ncbi:hypothetical protein D1BOALGB6SA_3868 [Olavius sp. associated proteobacterium Delta 1]|nr:hypothetical protein D1BOALGB6SA_3868 [Olavius sp. associated proteobacterium Delta 1]
MSARPPAQKKTAGLVEKKTLEKRILPRRINIEYRIMNVDSLLAEKYKPSRAMLGMEDDYWSLLWCEKVYNRTS